MHLLPAAWGVILTGTGAAWLEPATGGVMALAAAGIVGGLAAGLAAWTFFASRSHNRVSTLARAMAREVDAVALTSDGPDLAEGKPGP